MANIDLLPSVPPQGDVESRDGVRSAVRRLYVWFNDFLRALIALLGEINNEITELYGEADVTPGLIGTLAQVAKTVTVTNAIKGYTVRTSYDEDLAVLTMTSYVSADDTVTVVFFNGTAGGITPTAGRLRCYVSAKELSS